MESVAQLLPKVYRKLTQEAAAEEALLLSLWPVVAGEKVARHARAVRLFGATLIIETDSQEWRRQLASLGGTIVARLNAEAGQPLVRGLEFRVAMRQPALPPRRATSASGAESDESASIADPHLRRLYRISRKRAQARSQAK